MRQLRHDIRLQMETGMQFSLFSTNHLAKQGTIQDLDRQSSEFICFYLILDQIRRFKI